MLCKSQVLPLLVSLLGQWENQPGQAHAAQALGNLARGGAAQADTIAGAHAVDPLVHLVQQGEARGSGSAVMAIAVLVKGGDALVSRIVREGPYNHPMYPFCSFWGGALKRL